ncbi:MAG: hypothetical protein AB7L66_02550 [Gemmatimonadales bacterium]
MDPATSAPLPASDGFERPDGEADELLEDARRWDRVRDPHLLDPEAFLGQLVGGLLGARLDGIGGRLELALRVPEEWKTFRVRRLRAYRTLIDLEVRNRAEWVTVRLAAMFGPPLAVRIALGGERLVGRVTVDEVPLQGAEAIFTLASEHEVTFYLEG